MTDQSHRRARHRVSLLRAHLVLTNAIHRGRWLTYPTTHQLRAHHSAGPLSLRCKLAADHAPASSRSRGGAERQCHGRPRLAPVPWVAPMPPRRRFEYTVFLRHGAVALVETLDRGSQPVCPPASVAHQAFEPATSAVVEHQRITAWAVGNPGYVPALAGEVLCILDALVPQLEKTQSSTVFTGLAGTVRVHPRSEDVSSW